MQERRHGEVEGRRRSQVAIMGQQTLEIEPVSIDANKISISSTYARETIVEECG